VSTSSWWASISENVASEVLWEDGERVCRRMYIAGSDGARQEFVAVFLAAKVPSHDSINRLAHEYALKDCLDSAWALRPLNLVLERGRTLLVVEHPRGEPLSRLIALPMDIGQFLRIATALSAAVRRLHGSGLIHKDLKPSNILVNMATGEVWLTGFGIASRLPRERQAPVPPGTIAGTLAYMSPEQTGRMNRSIDTRSDLYSVGVTLYQMLTGVLPFAAADPLEWVHCHIARQPIAPVNRRDVPEPLSAIIMKLLAKNAEERYQTAAGLEADLWRCLVQWQSHGPINSFPLGANDVPDRLLIPEKLYGREREVDALLAAFDRVVYGGRPELVLVSGYSGIGKSAVVNELHKPMVPHCGLFASGKYDQYKRDIPYATVAQAFQNLIRPLLSMPEAELSKWRDDLLSALNPNGALLVDLVPELTLIIGEQPTVSALPSRDAKSRAHLAFRRFIGVFARTGHPLALFLDDLQWLDSATLDFLEDLLLQQDVAHLLVVGAYRDNEVDSAHPLMQKLSAIREAGTTVEEIRMVPLSSGDLADLIADALHCESQPAMLLAQLVHAKTAGNPFFAIQFIYALVEEGLISFEHGDARWRWDLDAIHAKGYTNNVVDLMVAKLSRIPVTTQKALQQLACIGDGAEIATLSAVLEISEKESDEVLWEALQLGLVIRSENGYRFAHDRVHEAAYSLVAVESRAGAHLRIGRLLNASTSPEKRDVLIFEIVSQLNRGADLITSGDERFALADLNLIAGKRAKGSTAYNSALTYLKAGRALLADNTWELRHDLIFQLELHLAECEFLTGKGTVAAEHIEILRTRASGTEELAMTTCLGIDVFTTIGQIGIAVTIFLQYLSHVEIEWPIHPTEEQVRREYAQIWAQLGSREIEEVVDFPLMNDAKSIATLDVLTKALVPTFWTDLNLYNLVICASVTLSIERGNNDGSCLNYVYLSYVAGHRFGDYKNAFRFAQLGYDLVEKRSLKRFQASTYHTFANMIMPWMKHPLVCCGVIREAFEIANKIGDLTYAVFSRMGLISLLIAAGEPLVAVQGEAEIGLNFAQKAQFGFGYDTITMLCGFIRTLRGLTTSFGSFDHAEFNEIDFERNLNNPMALCWYRVRKLQSHFFAGDYALAIEDSLRAQTLLSFSPGNEMAEYEFYSALAHAACCDVATIERSREHFEALGDHYRRLQEWAEHRPENFENRASLVGAEIARIEGRELDATRLYEKAIRSAREHAFVHNEAVAYEVAARFYAARGFEIFADAYLLNARNCYERWGAYGKVKQLDERYPFLREGRTTTSAGTIGVRTGQLDVETVVKASQALSSEIVLPRLIEKLVQIAVEHAGAERGLLILMQGSEPSIEAEGVTYPGKIEVVIRQSVATPSDLPQTVLHYVIRTQECLILDNASTDDVYSKDEYVLRHRTRSVLCLPIVKRGKLVGALYLENNLASYVFTPNRVAVLQLLASQAAISLENAALYSDQQLQAEILQNLPVSAWTLRPNGTPDFVNQVWLDYSGQTIEFVRSQPEAWMSAIHPDDRESALKAFWGGVSSEKAFVVETRLRNRDGRYRWHINQAVVLRDGEGRLLKFVGTTTDIDDQKRAEQAFARAREELARITRVTSLGALTASIAHEVSQPLAGIITNAGTFIRMLAASPPNVEGARETARRMIRDTNRATEVIARLRALFSKESSVMELVDLNEATREVIALSLVQIQQGQVILRTELSEGLPAVVGDRVQLQQVVLNLLLNAVDSMSNVDDRPRGLLVVTERHENDCVRLSVTDSGTGFGHQSAEKIFEAFYTTKTDGMGIGLFISRSIIENHGGSLWAAPNEGPGVTFSFSIPSNNDDAVVTDDGVTTTSPA
jgi:PAS domain S-box-containing protein